MLLRGSNTRSTRGSTANRSRGSRGRGATSRGASNSSSKSDARHKNIPPIIPSGPRALQDNFNTYNSRGAGKQLKYQRKNSHSSSTGTSSKTETPNAFEQERLDNAAKREQRGHHNGTMVNGRGGKGTPRGGLHANKQVRFTDSPAEQKVDPFSKAASTAPSSNPFGGNTNTNSSPFSSPANGVSNPFGAKQDATTKSNPFSTLSSTSSPFGAPSQPNPPSTGVFGTPSGNQAGTKSTNPFGAPSQPSTSTSSVFGMPSGEPATKAFKQPSTGVFGAPAGPKAALPSTNAFNKPPTTVGASSNPSFSSPFGSTSPQTNGFSSAAPSPKTSFAPPNPTPFGALTNGNTSNYSHESNGASNAFGSRPTSTSAPSNGAFPKPSTNGFSTTKPSPLSKFPPSASRANGTASSAAAAKIDQLLRKERIIAPSWPDSTPNDPNFKPAIETYWRASKEYRNKVRACLIRAGLFDDPDKPKKLSEAIDFNGICEDMCPDFEKANRIYERNVMGAETVVGPDGQSYPAPHKMIKAFARSAAGQDAPLPMDVRSPAALTRTLDYLFRSVLGDDEENLPKVHHFLWDRTREIRRDFVFQQASINTSELPDQIYCLEHITRFHVMALHQLSREGVQPAEEFIEQQEREQLGKTLLSLMQTYDDCAIQGVDCKNEAEFRSYYALLNSDSPGILQTVQNWGWKYWGESDQIRTAITLVEALQNTWDPRGPLKPQATTDVAQNAFSRFFTIVADKKVSYTMACFAEIHFNSVRKSILKTILASYRKQRDQTKDWTLSKLNEYLRFDDEGDIISFAEAYGLRFDDIDGEECLSFESEGVSDPFPPLKQSHSYDLVERKRGYHSLLEVIYSTVYDEGEENIQESVEEDGIEEESLFVNDDSSTQQTEPANFPTTTNDSSSGQEANEAVVQEGATMPGSLFDRITQPKTFNNDFFTSKPAEQPPVAQPDPPLFFPKAPETEVSGAPPVAKQPDSPFSFTKKLETPLPSTQQSDPSSLFSKQPAKKPPSNLEESTPTQPLPLFNFGQPPSTTPTENNTQEPLSLGKYAISAAPPETLKPPSFLGQQPVAVSESSNRPAFPTSQSPLPQSSLFNEPPAATPAFPPLQQDAASVPPQPEAPNFFQNKFQEISGQSQMNPINWSNQPLKLGREARLDGLANWVALGDDGLLEHFTQLTVENILKETVKRFQKEEYEKAVKRADDLARKEADQFRQYFLSTKYLNKWRQGARQLWQKRVGRENRQAMREMAESMRASKAAQSANMVEDFRASARASAGSSRRGSLESLLDATGILSGVHDSQRQIRAIVQNEDESTFKKPQQSERSIKKPTKRHQRGKSDVPPLRRSLMSDSSYLNGGSRIHLMPTYDIKDENRRQVSGVKTDYFRLKARGITTLPGGIPMPTSAAKDFLRQKRSFDGISKQSTPQRPSHSSIPRSIPSRYSTEAGHRETTTETDGNIRDLKERAGAVVLDDSQTRRKRSFDKDNDDEALFERAKRVREQMDEGSKWYRKELERHSRSIS